MKTFVRSLWGNDPKPLWDNAAQRDALRGYLNDQGFYVLTGAGDSLEVYVTEDVTPWDIKIVEKSLDRLEKFWYTISRRKTK